MISSSFLVRVLPLALTTTFATNTQASLLTNGLIQDLDADSGVVVGGASVTAWQNQTASGGDDLTTVGGTPTLVPGPNGGNAIRLGPNTQLAGNDATAFDGLMTGNGFTWFAVIRSGSQDGPSKNGIFGTLLATGSQTGFAAHVGSDNFGRNLVRPTNSDHSAMGSGNLATGWHIVTGRLQAGTGAQSAEVFTDGPIADAGISVTIQGATDSGVLSVGTDGSGPEHFDGDVARILIYDRPLTDTELNSVGVELVSLYGIAETGFITDPLPAIPSFTATPNPASPGQTVTLSWSVIDPEGNQPSLAITPTVGDVTGLTSVQVNPNATTTYTLAAENNAGGNAAEVTVTVGESPTIHSFSTTTPNLRPGDSAALNWNVSGATSIAINQGVGNVSANGSTSVSPATTTTYTLTAGNVFGTTEAQVTLDVDLSPKINSFTIDQVNIDPGTSVTLSWNVDDAVSLIIDNGVGDVSAQTSVQDTPGTSRLYTLTATNAHGTSQATASVIVGETLTISEFLAANDGGLLDEDGDDSDWIEIHNTTGSTISLDGWHLTDDAGDLTKWQFPDVTLNGGDYLVVFASSKNRSVAGSELHTNFRLDREGEFLALVKPDGLTVTRQYAPAYPEQVTNNSYGLYGIQLDEGFFDPPTPGAPNGTGYLGFVEDTTFSIDRGFYDAPIQVAISTPTPSSLIFYTLDGSEPSLTNGTVYSGPLLIDSTTVLRAFAFRRNHRSSNIDTQTYLFPSDIKTQPDMDPDVVNAAPYSSSIEDDLKAIPTLSLVLPDESMFGASGIYTNSGSRGIAWERAVSVEFFSADGSEEFQYDAGIRIHGANARSHQKKPFRLYFRDIYGPGKLRYPLFPGEVQEYDKLVLRGGGHEAWTSPFGSGTGAQAHSATYLRDQFLRQTHGDMGNLSPRGRFAHLYINGTYWGLYIIHERPDDEFGAIHLGGEELDYDVINTGGSIVDGDKANWNEVQALANAGLTDFSDYLAVLNQLDVNSLIDNMIVRIWSGDVDWLRSTNELGHTGNRNKNWYTLRKTRNGALGWHFYVWDGELSMGKGHRSNRLTNLNITDVDASDSPGRLYTKLRENPEFRLLFADRLHKHFFNDGAMTPSANQARWHGLSTEIQDAVVAESARWGDATRGTPYTRDGEWQSEVDWMHDTFMAVRTATVLSQFEAIGLYPALDAPEFLVDDVPQHGGEIGSSLISFAPIPGATIYYTDDGSDPRRAFRGTVNPSAQAYTVPFALPSSKLLRVRAYDGAEWSALTEAIFVPGTPPSSGNLAVTEVHYRPLGPQTPAELAAGPDRSDFEFIEIMNTGNDVIDLGAASFSGGIAFTFPVGTLLPAGARLVLANNTAAFTERYGTAPDGEFTNNLDDGGETLTFLAADGSTVIQEFTYDDRFPWPESADGDGFSLVLIAPETNPPHHLPASWRASVSVGGSPGASDAVPLASDPNGDDNNNGLSNLMEHALGGTERPSISWSTFTVNGTPETHLAFTFRKNLAADDVRYAVQISKDLQTWTTLPHTHLDSSTNNTDGTATEVWRALPAPTTDEPCFARLLVELR